MLYRKGEAERGVRPEELSWKVILNTLVRAGFSKKVNIRTETMQIFRGSHVESEERQIQR
jgi:hypothetical protein